MTEIVFGMRRDWNDLNNRMKKKELRMDNRKVLDILSPSKSKSSSTISNMFFELTFQLVRARDCKVALHFSTWLFVCLFFYTFVVIGRYVSRMPSNIEWMYTHTHRESLFRVVVLSMRNTEPNQMHIVQWICSTCWFAKIVFSVHYLGDSFNIRPCLATLDWM